MKKRWILIGLISLFGYNICDQLDKPKKHNLTFEKIITVKSKTKPKVKVKVKKTKHEEIDFWIKHYSKRYNVDWKLVKAIGILESGLNPKARNKHSTASGLFQFLKQTNEDWHRVLGIKNFNHYNVPIDRQCELVCLYLKYLHKKYDNNRHLALKEYSGNGIGSLYQKKIKYNIAMLNKGYDYSYKKGWYLKIKNSL